jgi:dephospho-CoA kinase
MVIALVGHPAAGKDSSAHYFIKKNFLHISSGDILREMMRERNIPIDRAHTYAFAKEMRSERGNSFPAEEIVRRIMNHASENTVISGLRNLSAVDYLRKRLGQNFFLVAIESPLKTRYERILARKRSGDAVTFEQFKAEEDRERRDPSGAHEMDSVIAAADAVVENNGTREELFEKLEAVLMKFTQETVR